jgi:hypothetical protein
VAGATLVLDGFNVLTTVEAALGGAVVLRGRDGACRDLMGVHGTYRKVEETLPAIARLGAVLEALAPAHVEWLLDRPVSNSGRLRSLLLAAAAEHDWSWDVALALDPDPHLATSTAIVATADSAILDQGPRWLNLASEALSRSVPDGHLVDLDVPPL